MLASISDLSHSLFRILTEESIMKWIKALGPSQEYQKGILETLDGELLSPLLLQQISIQPSKQALLAMEPSIERLVKEDVSWREWLVDRLSLNIVSPFLSSKNVQEGKVLCRKVIPLSAITGKAEDATLGRFTIKVVPIQRKEGEEDEDKEGEDYETAFHHPEEMIEKIRTESFIEREEETTILSENRIEEKKKRRKDTLLSHPPSVPRSPLRSKKEKKQKGDEGKPKHSFSFTEEEMHRLAGKALVHQMAEDLFHHSLDKAMHTLSHTIQDSEFDLWANGAHCLLLVWYDTTTCEESSVLVSQEETSRLLMEAREEGVDTEKFILAACLALYKRETEGR